MYTVLHVTSGSGMYGKEKVILSLMELQGSFLNLHSSCSVDAAFLNGEDYWNVYANGMSNQIRLATLKFLIQENRYPIIHTHDYKSSFYCEWYRRRYGAKVKIVRTLHGETASSPCSRVYWYQKLDRWVVRLHDRVIPLMGVNGIPNGIADPHVTRSTEHQKHKKKLLSFISEGIIFVSTGRLAPEKNYGSLIEALALCDNPKIKVLLLGEGPLRKQLTEQAARLGVSEQLFFTGFVENPIEFFKHCDFYIQPSLREGVPLAVVEAAATCIPLLVSRVGGMANFIDSGAADEIGTTPESIAAQMRTLSEKYQCRRKPGLNSFNMNRRKSDAARQLFVSDYHLERMLARYHKIYSEFSNS